MDEDDSEPMDEDETTLDDVASLCDSSMDEDGTTLTGSSMDEDMDEDRATSSSR
jgi:hypothetical protein